MAPTPRHLHLLILLLLLGTAFAATATDITDKAAAMIKRGEYKQAAMLLRPEAEKGEPQASFLAAQLFFDGKGVIKSEQQGFKYLTQAADKGMSDAVAYLAYKKEQKGDIKGAVAALEKFRADFPDTFGQFDNNPLPLTLGKLYRDRYAELGIDRNEATRKAWEVVRTNGAGMNDIRSNPGPWLESLMALHNTDLQGLADYFMSQFDFFMPNDVILPYYTKNYTTLDGIDLDKLSRQAAKGNTLACVAAAEWNFDHASLENAIRASRELMADNGRDRGAFFNYWKKFYGSYYLPGDVVDGKLVFKTDPLGKIPMVASASCEAYRLPNLRDFHENNSNWRFPTQEELKKLTEVARSSNFGDHKYADYYKNSRSAINPKKYQDRACLVTELADGPVYYKVSYPGSSAVINVKSVVNAGSYTKVVLLYWWNRANPAPRDTPFNKDAVLKCRGEEYPLLQWSYSTNPYHVDGSYYAADMTLYFSRIPDDWSTISISMPGCWNIPTVKHHDYDSYD